MLEIIYVIIYTIMVYGLKFINDNKLKAKMIFIHIPKEDKITDIEKLAKTIKEGVDPNE